MTAGGADQTATGSAARNKAGQRGQSELDSLIAAARGGSSSALDRLIEALSEHLWSEHIASRRANRTGPAHGSSDLVQDTLVRVREHFNRFERDTFADFRQWARTVLFRRRQEWSRNHRTRSAERHKHMIWSVVRARAESSLAGQTADQAVERDEELERAYALYEQLKPHEQFVIDLRLFHGLSYKQVAELVGTTEEAARKAYDRAVARLRTGYECHGKP